MPRLRLLLLGVAVVLLLAGPWIGMDQYWVTQVSLIAVLALIVSGLNLSYGYAGELALGQVAMYAVGAYLAAILALQVTPNLFVTLPAAGAGAMLVGVVSGVPGVRLAGWALAMVSFFLVLLIPNLVQIFQSQTGGYNGLPGIPAPTIGGYSLTSNGIYLLTLLVTLGWLVVMRNLVTSRYGEGLRVLRESRGLAPSLGISTSRIKLVAYVLGALPAGLAGALYVYRIQFVSPDAFSFDMAVAVIAGSILGGAESVFGAVFGATLLELGPLRATSFQQYSLVVYGAFLVVGGVLFSGGLTGAGADLLRWARRRLRPTAATTRAGIGPRGPRQPAGILRPAVLSGPLEVLGVWKSFGGLVALEEVTVTASPGMVTALIGANGSGKTTLLNLISGLVKADVGTITLGGKSLVGLAPHRVSRMGVARTFQTPAIPRSARVVNVVASARFGRVRVGAIATMLRLPRFRRVAAEDREIAMVCLQDCGLAHLAEELALQLPLGTRRLIEVARAMAAGAQLLLLDEPASGLEPAELDELKQIVADIRASGVTLVLVEHNFKFVTEIADRVYVLDHGRVLAHGTVQEVEQDPSVLASYFGAAVRAESTEERLSPSHPGPVDPSRP